MFGVISTGANRRFPSPNLEVPRWLWFVINRERFACRRFLNSTDYALLRNFALRYGVIAGWVFVSGEKWPFGEFARDDMESPRL